MVQDRLRSAIVDSTVRVRAKATAYKSDTFGFYVAVASLRRDRGAAFEVWLDLFPNVGRPILSVCYDSTSLERVKAIARANDTRRLDRPTLAIRDLGRPTPGGQVLARALPTRLLTVPIIEAYRTSFLTFYLAEQIRVDRTPGANLVDKVVTLLARLLRAAASLNGGTSGAAKDYPAVENRRRVRQHLARERSSRLASEAKLRDGFTCQVCGFNFAERYGELGRGYAEAHHKVPLSSLKGTVRTRRDDLITVCANCHRVLHRRTSGVAADIGRLKKAVAATRGRASK